MVASPWGQYHDGEPLTRGIRVTVARWRKFHSSMMPTTAKACGQYVNSVLAIRDAVAAGFDEAVLLDAAGNLAEGSGENLFIVRDGGVATSRVVACPEGITRATVIEICASENIPCLETDLPVVEVYDAQEVFCTGTMGELASVVKIDDRQIGDGKVGPMTNRLSDFYAQRTAKEGVQMI